MSRTSTPATQPARQTETTQSAVRWYAAVAGLLNLLVLCLVVKRFHYAYTPINHGLARILAMAWAVNLAGSAAILWLAWVRGWQRCASLIVRVDFVVSLWPLVMARLIHGERARVFHLFAFVYVIFLLCRMAELLIYTGLNADDRSHRVRLPVLVFAATFMVYGGVVPWMALASSPQGDEPHYLLLARSLAVDHDFEVGDEYSKGAYKETYPTPPPGAMRGYPYAFMERDTINYLPHEPHVVKNFRGQLMLWHDPGFPLLLVPGYALDRREGGLFTLALIAALGTSAIFESAMLLGAGLWPALITVVIFGFTCPYWVFSQSVISDLCGGVAVSWIALQFFRYRAQPRNRYLLLAGCLIAVMPWLNIRWWSLAGPAFLVFCAWVIRNSSADRRAMIGKLGRLSVPSVLGLTAFSALDKALFNTYKPNASMLLLDRVMPQFQHHPIHGFLGMLFDQGYGLIPTAPLYVAVLAGLIVLYRRDRWAFAMLFLPVLGYLPFIAFSQFWFAGWNAPARYMVSATTLMIPAASLVLNRKVRWIVVVLAAWSFLISIMFTVNPYLRMPSIWDMYHRSMLVEFFHDHIHTTLYSILSIYPDMMQVRPWDYLLGTAWLVVFIVVASAWAGTATGPEMKR